MRKSVFLILMVLIMLFLISNAYAFDGKRKGFFLGGGLGPGFTSFKETITYSGWFDGESSESSDWESKFGLMTNFKIGYAPSDVVEIHYTNKISWFASKVYFFGESMGEDVTMASGLSALGVTYYFKPEAPSPFIAGGVGLSTLSLPFESHSEIKFGGGLFAGGGYEFTRHFSVELDLIWGKVSDLALFGIGSSTNVLSVTLTVNALAY
jgi:hypothetical protein